MDIVIRAAVMFVLLTLLLRVVGRRELGEMEPADLVLLVVMGDLVQQAITQSDTSVTGAGLAVTTMALMAVGSSYLAFRFRALRPVIEGRPVVLISDGELMRDNLRAERISLEELTSQARLQQIGSLSEVRWAIQETSGRISFIRR
ncbi:MAG: DUF421 domain-containing protein [Thermoleophilia bacterium]